MKNPQITSAVKIKSNNGRDAVIINNEYSVTTSSDGRFFVSHNIAKGSPSPDQDCTPFINAFCKYFADAENARLAKIEEERIAEAKRLDDLRTRIVKCNTPQELAVEFDLTLVDLGSNWHSLYAVGLLICNQHDYEIVNIAADLHDCDGQFVQATRRDGHNWSEPAGYFTDLKDYQESISNHFNGDKFFYNSQEVDKDFYLEQIKEAAENKDMEKVLSLVKAYNDIEPGFYDCNGNLEMSDEALSDPDLSGYSYDVYNYSFCYNIGRRNSWKDESGDDEDA